MYAAIRKDAKSVQEEDSSNASVTNQSNSKKMMNSNIRNILAGRGGVLKIVIDVDKPLTLPDETLKVAVALLEEALSLKLFRVNPAQTQVVIVAREKFNTQSDSKLNG